VDQLYQQQPNLSYTKQNAFQNKIQFSFTYKRHNDNVYHLRG
jgi:hypothetical protein